MPTIILLDASLSMFRSSDQEEIGSDRNQKIALKCLASSGVDRLLTYLEANNKLEYVALIAFSSLWDLLVPFTRDYESVKAAMVNSIQDYYDKTDLLNALSGWLLVTAPSEGAEKVFVEKWSLTTACNIILVTDGDPGINSPLLEKHNLLNLDEQPLPFDFPNKLVVVTLTGDKNRTSFEKLLRMNDNKGRIVCPARCTLNSVHELFEDIAEDLFKPCISKLFCGHLSSGVQLIPRLEIETTVESLHICGFLPMDRVTSPPADTRHLVLPLGDDGKVPNLCVLLHGSLKCESAVCIVRFGDRSGILHSWSDSKKKSNLMLSIFVAGLFPWFDQMCGTPEPVVPLPSYSTSCVTWAKPQSLQSDVQKVLRLAKRLPEKSTLFYKELNRLRRAALCFSFFELIDKVSAILERDAVFGYGRETMLHAANCLRESVNKGLDDVIKPP